MRDRLRRFAVVGLIATVVDVGLLVQLPLAHEEALEDVLGFGCCVLGDSGNDADARI